MKRIDGDESVAFQLAAALRALSSARERLHGGDNIGAMEKVVVADMVLNRAVCDLEAITGVPWGAIPMEPRIGLNEPKPAE